MKIAIYGAGNYGHYVLNEIMNHECAKVTVEFWIDNYVKEQDICGLPVYTENCFFAEHKCDIIDAVIIAIDRAHIAYEVASSLLQQGYKSVLLALPRGLEPQIPILDENGNLGSLVKSYKYFEKIKPTLPYIEFAVTHYCNLKCKRCANYSNLVTENEFLDLDKYESYLVQLKKKFKNIGNFILIGGEPLLNPHLDAYIYLARKYFPDIFLQIVTNGLCIPNMPTKLVSAIVKCNVHVMVSQYPPTREKLEQIIEVFEKEQIDYEITEPRTQFRKMITTKEENGEESFIKYAQTECGCHVLNEGRIYVCGNIPRLYAMQDYFQIHITEKELINSSIDLMDDGVDGWDIVQYIQKPAPLCRFCDPGDVWVPWELGQPQKEDWIVD